MKKYNTYYDKLNIYVPQHIAAIIDYDARMFEIFKNDGISINRNKFLSKLILNFYNDFTTNHQNKFNLIKNELMKFEVDSNCIDSIANSLARIDDYSFVSKSKVKKSVKLSLKPTKETWPVLNVIENELMQNDYLSHYFYRMLLSYCNMPFDLRERIIFKQEYDELKRACDDKTTINFCIKWDKSEMHKVFPYKIVTGKEEMFNYLLCIELDKNTDTPVTRSYRLSRITGISPSKDVIDYEQILIKYLDEMAKNSPQFAINRDEEFCVKLNERGVRLYNRIYHNRPIVQRIEENDDGYYYYFIGAEDQVFLYFRRFEKDTAIIVSPKMLRDRMEASYRDNLAAYERSSK